MAELDRIVTVTLTRESTPVSTASFQIPLVLASFTNFSERTRVYTDLDAVEDDFKEGDAVHEIAEKLFGQSTVGAVPPSIVVGRRQIDSVSITPTVANNAVYTVTIDGVAYSYTSGASATAAEIATGLDTAIGTLTGINATVAGDVITVAVATTGSPWSISTSTNLVKTDAESTESWTDALSFVDDENDTWYALVAATHVADEVEEISDAINARRKIYGTSYSDTGAIQATTTDIAATLEAKNADRTFGIFLPTADTEYPEAAWIGAQLAYTPGSNDWDKKQAVGVTRSVINDTARANLRAKHSNMYTRVAGVDVFQDGDTFGGSPIDLKKVA